MNTTLLAALALGGAALSVKKPTQNHNLMRLPSFRGIAEVRASLPDGCGSICPPYPPTAKPQRK